MEGNPYELPKDLLHEVIVRTIEFDNMSNDIIRTAFGLELKWDPNPDNHAPVNLNDISKFNRFFLEGLGSSSRAELLMEIIDETCEYNKCDKISCKDFKNKLINFYKIRNIFAHNIYPKDLKGFTRIDTIEPPWGELNSQHKILFEEIKKFLSDNMYIKVKI